MLAITDPVQSVLAARLIQRLGHTPAHRVQSWNAALDAISKHPADVWLVDARLFPRDEAPAPAALPWIIAITAAIDDLHGVPKHRYDDVLTSPLSLQSLSEALLRRRIPGAPPDDFSATTWSELLRLFGPAGVSELIGALRKDLPMTRARQEQAALEHDLPALKRVAHSLRGASLQLGADDLARLCASAEQAALDESPVASQLGAQALARYSALIERLEDELQRA